MHKPTTLIIKERGSFHEAFDSFPITDEHGHLLLTCRHIHNSLSSLLDVFDKHGHLLVTLKSRPEGGHRSFYGQAPDGKVVFELREVLRNRELLTSSEHEETEGHERMLMDSREERVHSHVPECFK